MAREQTVGDSVVGEGDGHENHDGHDGVDEIGEADFESVVLRDMDVGEAGLEDGETGRSDDAVVELAVGALETVSEVEEEAGEGGEGEEEVDHHGADRRAVAFAGDGGEEHLEGEEGAGGEEVHQH